MSGSVSASLAERERTLRRREADLARRVAAARRREDAPFVSDLVRMEIITPQLATLVAGLLSRASREAEAVFAEGRPKETEHQALRHLLSVLPRPVDLTGIAEGTELQRLMVDPSTEGLTAAAETLMRALAKVGKPIAFREAVRIVSKTLPAVTA